MIVVINKMEAAALTMHMNVMRPSFRNITKKNYPDKLKEYISSYDYIKNESSMALEYEVDTYNLNLNIVDLNVLQAFLKAYIDKSQKVNDEAKSEEFQQHLDALNNVQIKCQELKSA